jgi:hypothetical protein
MERRRTKKFWRFLSQYSHLATPKPMSAMGQKLTRPPATAYVGFVQKRDPSWFQFEGAALTRGTPSEL